jgi:ankyrin repeat protein
MDRKNHRRRPLHLAVVSKRPESLAMLLELGADTETTDAAGLTGLDQAAISSDHAMVRALLDAGAAVNLPAAIALQRVSDIERVLRAEPDALKPGQRWGTLIVRASEQAPGHIIETLIRLGASANATDDERTSVDSTARYTPLHAAAFHGNADAVVALLRHGADPNTRDSKYFGTPAGWAAYAGHHEVRDLILGARIDLFQAIDFDLTDRITSIVQQEPWLLNKPFGDYIANEPVGMQWGPRSWHTPLAWAVSENKIDAVRALLEQGAAQVPAPDGRTLRDIAVEAGHDDVARLLQQHERIDQTHAGRVRWFIRNACPDHQVRGRPDLDIARHTAERLLNRYPEIAQDSFYTAVVCGNVEEVARALTERPDAANQSGGPKGWSPLLYLCFTRLPSLAAANDNAVRIAQLLLDHGADPNAFFMAGDSRYTPLVGAIGEGEEDRPAHPQRDTLVRLLLKRGAEPYDTQVIYNIHFHGHVRWFLELIYERSVQLGRQADWDDPDWSMLDMGGYGNGARWHLDIAVKHHDLALTQWLLSHGASPNAPPAADPRLPKGSVHEEAQRAGLTGLAELLVRHGATVKEVAADAEAEFQAAIQRLDADKAQSLSEAQPGLLRSTRFLFSAAERDQSEVVELLLNLGMSIELADAQGQRALHVAAYHGSLRVAKLLIDRGAEIDPTESRWHSTPLGWAVHAQRWPLIELLSHHSRDIWNLTFTGNVERVREVLTSEPDRAKIVNANRWTPLMWLPDDEARAIEIIELLLAHGADPTIKNKEGMTAADYAHRRGLSDAAAILSAAISD